MKRKVLMGLAAIMMVAVLVSCGKKPQAEIDVAIAAVQAAKTAEANVYLPAEFAAVNDSMNAVNAEIEAQSSKMFKKFGPAKEQLLKVTTLANELSVNAAAKKNEVKMEVETALAAMKGVVEENKALITKAPRGKDGAAALEQIKTEMAGLEAATTEIETIYNSGAYMDALNKVKASNDSAVRINTELKDAIAKVRR
jgi:hypothetical protein